MTYRVLGLDPAPFRVLYGLDDDRLTARGVRRVVADTSPGYPDRIEMRDAAPGEALLLVNFVHQEADTPYRASHAIFVREGAERRYDCVGEVPEVMRIRPLSVRAFSAGGMMVDAELIDGEQAAECFARLLDNADTAYLQVHNAVRGCYSGRVERA